jgi:hypothetical protein
VIDLSGTHFASIFDPFAFMLLFLYFLLHLFSSSFFCHKFPTPK